MRRLQWQAPVDPAPLEAFDWAIVDLLRPGSDCIRGLLRDIESAIRRGRFEGDAMRPKRLALLRALTALGDGPDLNPRVAIRFARVYALLTRGEPK